jgi:spore germination protein
MYQEKGKTQMMDLETVSDSYDDLLPRFNSKSEFPNEVGQLRMALFGKDFAKQGIEAVLNNYDLDPDVGTRMQLGVADGKAETILRITKKMNLPFHLSDKILHNMKNGNLPKMNLHVFLENYYSEGRDPYTTFLTLEKGQIKIDGLALFKKGKYVDHIDLRQSFLLKMLIDGATHGSYEIRMKENKNEGFILLNELSAKTKYKINAAESIPDISINVTINALIKDVPPWLYLSETKNIRELENTINTQFTKDILDLISLFQKYGVDPIGLGDMVRSKSKQWDYERFQAIYPQLKPTVNTTVKIIQTGIGG